MRWLSDYTDRGAVTSLEEQGPSTSIATVFADQPGRRRPKWAVFMAPCGPYYWMTKPPVGALWTGRPNLEATPYGKVAHLVDSGVEYQG